MLDASFLRGPGLVPALLVEELGVALKEQWWAEYIADCPSAGEGDSTFTFSGIFREPDRGESVPRGPSG